MLNTAPADPDGCGEERLPAIERSALPVGLHPAEGASSARPLSVTSVRHGRYTGYATTVVSYVDPLTFRPFAQDVFAVHSTARIGAPDRAFQANQRERNPFNLVVTPTRASTTGINGEVYLLSAGVHFRGSRTSEFMLRYWRLTLTDSGFRGTLTDNGSSVAGNSQMIWAPALLVPGRPNLGVYTSSYQLYDGRYGAQYQGTLRATASGSSLRIVYKGWGSTGGSNLAYFETTLRLRRR